MLTVSDQLWISGLTDEKRAIVDRFVDDEVVRRGYTRPPNPDALRREFERGYKAGAADGSRQKENTQ
jgi:hypothetical protein